MARRSCVKRSIVEQGTVSIVRETSNLLYPDQESAFPCLNHGGSVLLPAATIVNRFHADGTIGTLAPLAFLIIATIEHSYERSNIKMRKVSKVMKKIGKSNPRILFSRRHASINLENKLILNHCTIKFETFGIFNFNLKY